MNPADEKQIRYLIRRLKNVREIVQEIDNDIKALGIAPGATDHTFNAWIELSRAKSALRDAKEKDQCQS